MKTMTKTPKTRNFFVSCIAHTGKVVNGGWVRTRSKTEAGLLRAAVLQVWSASPAALCGYRLKKIIVEPACPKDYFERGTVIEFDGGVIVSAD